ncbi:MAG TPA: PKD domain-containing protein [Granulicella sp.]
MRRSFFVQATATVTCFLLACSGARRIHALDQPTKEFKIYQFPPDKIPQIDGNEADWADVPDSYTIGTDQLHDDRGKNTGPDLSSLDVHVKVGWVKGLNRLYFLYEATDDYWDFSDPGLHNDTFELVVDGDRSGGPLIPRFRTNPEQDEWEAHFSMHGVQAQNYHIFTPAEGKDWTLAWGCQPWIKEMPYANHAAKYSFKPGQPGKYVMEFWITPFDYASCDGPAKSVESKLEENKLIGMAWAVIDYDGPNGGKSNGFWNLSSQHQMFGIANELRAFRLMPLEDKYRPKGVQAQWSFTVLDMKRRLVAFEDQSAGNVTSWKWDFGDGTTSNEQHPLHSYKEPGAYIVVLYVEGPEGKSRMSKIWDVNVR